MFNKKQKGFTLIELLVVIAIIGLLAGIVLVSLGGARDSARDARIQGGLQQTKSVAELVFNNASPLAYTSLCETVGNTLDETHATYGTQLGNLETDISDQNGGTTPTCFAAGDEYCVFAPMATANQWACANEEGGVVVTSTDPALAGNCTATTFVCP